ncbi:MAG: hypothetical protein DWQ19_10495 [Crenarchaeota archaeon]|nr:MAG: hypothetical protein DWQ19_10495 [Thermoproteota archaeon]
MFRTLNLFVIILLLLAGNCFAQKTVYFQTLPVPAGVQPSNDPSIPKIEWNRWTTKNFSIHSIDYDQGEFLFHNIEKMKSWCLTRWGLPDIQFSSECRIFCAPTKELMKKLFNLDNSYGEVKIQDGKIVISYLWLVLDSKPAEVIPPALTVICLKEFNQQYRLNIGWWTYRGVPILNETLPQIRNNLVRVNTENFSASSFFSMTESKFRTLNAEQRRGFDAEAAMMCLFIRKEFGQTKFQYFLKYDNFEDNVKKHLGFQNIAEFEKTFARYAANLSRDIKENKCPDAYLQIEAIKKK